MPPKKRNKRNLPPQAYDSVLPLPQPGQTRGLGGVSAPGLDASTSSDGFPFGGAPLPPPTVTTTTPPSLTPPTDPAPLPPPTSTSTVHISVSNDWVEITENDLRDALDQGASGVSVLAPNPQADNPSAASDSPVGEQPLLAIELPAALWTSYTAADVAALVEFLKSQKTAGGPGWRQILSAHTTSRSKQTRTRGGENVGGGIIKSLEACHEKRQLQHNEWEVVFDFPNSLKPNDAVPFTLTYTGNHDSKEDAMDAACLQALAHLLLRGPFQVLLSLSGVRACAFVFM